MPINLKCLRNVNKSYVEKKSCGKNLNVLTKSWSVKVWNFTKSIVMQGGFLLKIKMHLLLPVLRWWCPNSQSDYVCHHNKATIQWQTIWIKTSASTDWEWCGEIRVHSIIVRAPLWHGMASMTSQQNRNFMYTPFIPKTPGTYLYTV